MEHKNTPAPLLSPLELRRRSSSPPMDTLPQTDFFALLDQGSQLYHKDPKKYQKNAKVTADTINAVITSNDVKTWKTIKKLEEKDSRLQDDPFRTQWVDYLHSIHVLTIFNGNTPEYQNTLGDGKKTDINIITGVMFGFIKDLFATYERVNQVGEKEALGQIEKWLKYIKAAQDAVPTQIADVSILDGVLRDIRERKKEDKQIEWHVAVLKKQPLKIVHFYNKNTPIFAGMIGLVIGAASIGIAIAIAPAAVAAAFSITLSVIGVIGAIVTSGIVGATLFWVAGLCAIRFFPSKKFVQEEDSKSPQVPSVDVASMEVKKVDDSLKVMGDQSLTAVNSTGFAVRALNIDEDVLGQLHPFHPTLGEIEERSCASPNAVKQSIKHFRRHIRASSHGQVSMHNLTSEHSRRSSINNNRSPHALGASPQSSSSSTFAVPDDKEISLSVCKTLVQ
jgi:hypothetical protein